MMLARACDGIQMCACDLHKLVSAIAARLGLSIAAQHIAHASFRQTSSRRRWRRRQRCAVRGTSNHARALSYGFCRWCVWRGMSLTTRHIPNLRKGVMSPDGALCSRMFRFNVGHTRTSYIYIYWLLRGTTTGCATRWSSVICYVSRARHVAYDAGTYQLNARRPFVDARLTTLYAAMYT